MPPHTPDIPVFNLWKKRSFPNLSKAYSLQYGIGLVCIFLDWAVRQKAADLNPEDTLTMKQDHYVEQNFAQNPICYKQLVNRCNLCIMFRPSWHFVSWKNANEVFTASFPPERNVTCKTINPDKSRFDLNINSDSRWLIQQWSIRRIRYLSFNLPIFLSFFSLSKTKEYCKVSPLIKESFDEGQVLLPERHLVCFSFWKQIIFHITAPFLQNSSTFET